VLPARGQALLRTLTIDRPLEVEQRVDRKPATKASFPAVCSGRVFLETGKQWRL
jgi:hypothetical protein